MSADTKASDSQEGSTKDSLANQATQEYEAEAVPHREVVYAKTAHEQWLHFDPTDKGVLTMEELAAYFRSHPEYDQNDAEEVLRVMCSWCSHTKKEGHLTFVEFSRVFSFFENFKAGYTRGYQDGYAAKDSLLGEVKKRLTFHDFVKIVMESDKVFSHLERFNQNWKPARPGVLSSSHVELSPLEDFLAGTWSGIVTTVIGHPFDTVKLRMQTANIPRASDYVDLAKTMRPFGESETATQVIKRTIRDEGFRGLYKGMAAPMASVALVNSIVFMTYEQGKRLCYWLDGVDRSTNKVPPALSNNRLAVCGGMAGFAACIIVCPIELIRSRLQVQSSISPLYTGPVDCAVKVMRKNGPAALFKGMGSTILRDVPAYVAQFYVYEGTKKLLTPKGQTVNDLGAAELMFSGALAGIVGWFATYPIDIIKSRLQVERSNRYKQNRYFPDGGFLDCWKTLYRSDGWRGFYKGLAPCMVRAVPVGAGAFWAYESCSRFLKQRKREQR